jgi:hypothetical protein
LMAMKESKKVIKMYNRVSCSCAVWHARLPSCAGSLQAFDTVNLSRATHPCELTHQLYWAGVLCACRLPRCWWSLRPCGTRHG